MTAWSIASYVDNIAAAAKAAYDIVLYTNVWLMEQHGWVRAGESYPSGGGVSKSTRYLQMVYPAPGFIAPDNYELDAKGFAEVCANYAREDNPFFMPETIGDPNMFRAIADYNCLGNFFFGVEVLCTPEGEIRPERRLLLTASGVPPRPLPFC